MTRILLVADSVHTAAAACDYLEGRLREDDEVLAVSVVQPASDPRDGGDAVNVAQVRLGHLATVDSVVVEGEPAEAVLVLADDRDADEIVIGDRGGAPGSGPAIGSTATEIVAGTDRPVVVVPVTELE